MAVLTTIAAGYVVSAFAFCIKTAVMATSAVTAAVRVIPQAEIAKVSWAVTVLTYIIDGNVVTAFTCRFNAVVAAGTVVFDTGMVK